MVMKTIIFTIAATFLIPVFLAAQEAEKNDKNEPEEQIIVNKEYDENGNLIRFDSTYIFEWHGDTMMVFPGQGSFFPPDEFWGGFFSDSLNRFFPFDKEWGQSFFERHEDLMKEFNGRFFGGHDFNHDFFGGSPFGPDSLDRLFPRFAFPFDELDLPGFFENFERFSNPGSRFFDNEEQQKEWEEILKGYQKEMEKFNKKWDSLNKKKPGAGYQFQKL